MNETELLTHIYDLSIALDKYSAGKDYIALRNAHYNNIKWLKDHNLLSDYYDMVLNDLGLHNLKEV